MVAHLKPVFMQFHEKIFKLSDRQARTPTIGRQLKSLKVNLFPIISSVFHLSLRKASHLIATKNRLFGGINF